MREAEKRDLIVGSGGFVHETVEDDGIRCAVDVSVWTSGGWVHAWRSRIAPSSELIDLVHTGRHLAAVLQTGNPNVVLEQPQQP